MSSKKKFVIANWKMNPATLKEASSLFSEVKKFGRKYPVNVVICAPYPFLGTISEKVSQNVSVGAQNVSTEKQGAFTGEVSAKMLATTKVSYVIVGHSERRRLGETGEQISKKTLQALSERLTPVICIGEKERDGEGLFFNAIKEALTESLAGVSKVQISKVIIVYEPVWAISTEGKGAMDPHSIQETVIFIRKVLSDKYGKNIATKVRIIYGGSVDGENAHDVVTLGGCDGVLVGKASLKVKKFEPILEAVSK